MRIETDKIYCGDSLQVLQTLPDNCMDCCVTINATINMYKNDHIKMYKINST